MMEDTIAAIATPLGEGGLGVVRISGSRALDVASSLFRSRTPLSQTPSHTLLTGRLWDKDEPVDQALAAVFRAPRSYTGEDVVEVSCHGGAFLLKRALSLCLAAGARLAEPGEFTRRAFLNGKMDLAQAEAVADLIAAQSDAFRRLALEQLQGRLSAHLKPLRRQLLDLLAQLEANMDFVEDEIPALSRARLRDGLSALARVCESLLRTAPRGRLLREGVRVALVGKPNAGKSSLFNALLGSDRAIVTEVPGTTRDSLEERVLIRDVPVTLTDTAGLREGADRVEAEGMDRTRRALSRADVAVWVLDLSAPLSDDDKNVARQLQGKKTVLALNKSDLLAPGHPFHKDPAPFFSAVAGGETPPWVLTSAATGQGLEELRRALADRMGATNGLSAEPGAAPTLINVRHETLLKEALAGLETARAAADAGADEECLAVDLKGALDRLNQITGEGVHDEILRAIFSRFCVGK